ncbi:hypothetical protein [Pseudidiomarina sediminum]|nr:hypothetical protein [Pseudidiomarina sediminum]
MFLAKRDKGFQAHVLAIVKALLVMTAFIAQEVRLRCGFYTFGDNHHI